MVVNYLRAELLKQKRGFIYKLIWLMPLTSALLAFWLMSPIYIFNSGYNWWYITFLPFTVVYITVQLIKKDEKKNYHGLLLIASNKEKLWYAKILSGTFYLLLSTIFMSFLMLAGSKILGLYTLSTKVLLAANLVIFITFAWQIPFYMFINEKVNTFITIILTLFLDTVVACLMAPIHLWWIPFAIPARLMCPIIGVLPNGLLTSAHKNLMDPSVIVPGLLISLMLYIIVSFLTAKAFNKKEV